MKDKKSVIGVSIVCAILLVGIIIVLGTNTKGVNLKSEETTKIYSYSGEDENFEIVNGIIVISNEGYTIYSGELREKGDKITNMVNQETIFYTKSDDSVNEISHRISNCMEIQGRPLDIGTEVGKSTGSCNWKDEILDGLYFKLTVYTADCEKITSDIKLEVIEVGVGKQNQSNITNKNETNNKIPDKSRLTEVIDGDITNVIYAEDARENSDIKEYIEAKGFANMEEFLDSIIMDALVKSAAWKGIDIDTLEEYFVIDKAYEGTSKEEAEADEEVHRYYMFYLPKDINGVKKGTLVLQDGLDGMYATLSNNYLYEDCKKLIPLKSGSSISNNDNLDKTDVSDQKYDSENKDIEYKVTSPILKADDPTGVAVLLDYVDDEKIIFHGYFGLFIYDLEKEEITFSVDLKQAIGINNVQGSTCVDVLVSDDGKKLMLSKIGDVGSESEQSKESSLYVDTDTGEYYFAPYKRFTSLFSHTDPYSYSASFSEGKIGELAYIKDGKKYLVFEKYKLY